MGQFADGGRLAGTVYPEHQDGGRRWVEAQRRRSSEYIEEDLPQDGQAGCGISGVTTIAELPQDVLRGGDAHIAFDQRGLQLLEELGGRRADDPTKTRRQLRSRSGEALPQTVEPIHEAVEELKSWRVGKLRYIRPARIRLSNSPTLQLSNFPTTIS